jgi:hypothetical protein
MKTTLKSALAMNRSRADRVLAIEIKFLIYREP